MIACSLAVLLCSTAFAGQEISIAVDYGDYPFARQAARDHGRVNWRDADLSDDNVCTHAHAAVELQRYLRRLTGRRSSFPIVPLDPLPDGDVVVLSREHDESLDPQGFRIATQRRGGRRILTITGGSRVGTLYGAYRLLRHLGVRWYAPGRVNEEVPRITLDRLPDFNVEDAPAFSTRGFWAWEDRGNRDFFDWMARNGMNLWTDAEDNHPLLKKLGIKLTCGGHRHQDLFLSPRAEYRYNHPLFEGDEQKPTDPYAPPSEFSGDTNGDGKLTCFEAHPEWYGLRNGKRSDRIQDGFGDNFCTSNTDAVAELTKNLVQDLIDGEWRDSDTINFWTLDGGKWCECDNCKALGTPTDRNLLLVHHLRQAILEARREGRLHRDVQVMFLAYADVVEPPTRPVPEDFDYEGCIATFFPIVRCYVHALDDPTCTEYNARYQKHYYGWAVDPERHYRGQIFIGEYYNVSGYKCLPICFKSSMAHDISYYYDTGARHMHYMHCTTGNWGNKALTNYQLARMLWDPDLDVEALYHDYFRGRYGAAAPVLRGFYDSLETALSNVSELKYGLSRRLESDAANLLPREHMHYEAFAPEHNDGPDFVEMLAAAERCRVLIAKARSMDLPERIQVRLEEDERLFSYGHNTLRFYDEVIQTTLLLREGQEEEARAHYAEAAKWQALLEADTTSTKMSSSHGSAANGYVASYITGAWSRLGSRLGPVDMGHVPALDPASGPLKMWGSQFAGGGGPVYGYTLHCGGPLKAPKANYVYAKPTGARHTIQAFFMCEEPPTAPAYLALDAMTCPVREVGEVRVGVYLNDERVFEGVAPFPECELKWAEWEVPAALFRQGMNRLRIENLEPEGQSGQRPWFGLDRVEIAMGRRSERVKPVGAGQDLHLTYHSDIDDTDQPYRVYLPSSYKEGTPLPLVIALHGTGRDQNTLFGHPDFGAGTIKEAAEEYGLIVACPYGRGTTEYRGIGENDVFCVLEDVRRRFSIDEDRIYLTGHSMGGTGTTYLALRHPDVFAAAAPMASAYAKPLTVRNAIHTPFWFISGEDDWWCYLEEGPKPLSAAMKDLGYLADVWIIPKDDHRSFMPAIYGPLFEWLLQHKLERHPRKIAWTVYLPIHGRAWWVDVRQLERPGPPAIVETEIMKGNGVRIAAENVAAIAVRPDPELLDLAEPLHVTIDGRRVFSGTASEGEEVLCTQIAGRWQGRAGPGQARTLTAYRTHKIGRVIEPPGVEVPESPLGNLICDAIREATGADIAFCNHRHQRGIPLEAGDLYLVDLVNLLRPFNRLIATFEATGRDLIEIIEANITDEDRDQWLVQLSGARYEFEGNRVVDTDIDPDRTYKLACPSQLLQREKRDGMDLAGRFGRIDHELTDISVIGALYAYVLAHPELAALREGRVKER